MCLPGTIEAVREHESGVTRRAVLAGGGAAALGTLLPAAAQGQRRRRRRRARIVDLTHRFTAGFPLYTGAEPTRRTLVTIANDGFYSQQWTFGEHSGTHIDAPGHFVPGGRFTPELEPAELVLPVAVIDISARARRDPDTEVTANDLRRYERRHGRIPRGALVAMDSGWARKIRDEDAFKGTDDGGTYHFPGFSNSAIQWLQDERRVTAIGTDTLSLDHGPSQSFAVHINWLGANNYGIENLANLGRIPPSGAVATVGVIPWEEGSGGPARVLATY
jgi:kynurenine formamidase